MARPILSVKKAAKVSSPDKLSFRYFVSLVLGLIFLVVIVAAIQFTNNAENASHITASMKIAPRPKSVAISKSSDTLSKSIINTDSPIAPIALEESGIAKPAPSQSSVLSRSTSVGAPLDSRCFKSIDEINYEHHIVPPPPGPVTLVCCMTTKGPLNMAIHKSWAPVGAANFLNMIKFGFFDQKVALFRALKGFLVQFGLAGVPSEQVRYERDMLDGKGNLPDDPQWLPPGPPGRIIAGVERFRKGYISYAGAGKNSRGTQLIIAFGNNRYLGGGSPWEVPIGAVIGDLSMKVLDSIYTGYGEKISQGKIRNRGVSYLQEEFPLVDYILGCNVTAEDVPWTWRNASLNNIHG
jgi:peptidyl-prolyl cis-trans isomerase A (cyclophilin A)